MRPLAVPPILLELGPPYYSGADGKTRHVILLSYLRQRFGSARLDMLVNKGSSTTRRGAGPVHACEFDLVYRVGDGPAVRETIQFWRHADKGWQPSRVVAHDQMLAILLPSAGTDAGLAEWCRRFRGVPVDSVSLAGDAVTDAGLTALLQLGSVSRLDVGDHVTDEGLPTLAKLEGLRELHLGTSIGDTGLGYLEALGGLEVLVLRGERASSVGLAQLRSLRALKRLVLGQLELTDEGAGHLARLTTLEQLRASRARALTSAGVARLATLARLTSLDLGAPARPLGDADVAALAGGLPALIDLSLQNLGGLTDAGLAPLRGLKALERLSLYGIAGVTGGGLRAAVEGMKLEWLAVSDGGRISANDEAALKARIRQVRVQR